MNDTPKEGSFLPGFVLGAFLGGGIVFLLGTKKGKKLLQTITEEGFEGISSIEDLVEEVAEEYEEPEPLRATPPVQEVVKKEENKKIQTSTPAKEEYVEKPSSSKRFFKGVKKK